MSVPSPQPELDPIVAERRDYMRGEGFVLFTAANSRMVEVMAREPIKPLAISRYASDVGITLADGQAEGVDVSNAGLHLATLAIVNSSQVLARGRSFDDIARVAGLRPSDRSELDKRKVFNQGLDDRSFPFNFSAAIACAAVHALVRDDRLRSDQAASLGLGDWADIIGSGWFSGLIHSMAFTHNGIYGGFGSEIGSFKADALNRKMTNEIYPNLAAQPQVRALDTGYKSEPISGVKYLTAQLNGETRQQLRAAMRRSKTVEGLKRDSVGCPVARKVTRLPDPATRQNPYLEHLVDEGIMSVVPDAETGLVQVEQELTAIDRTLILHANRLDEYDELYGMPYPEAKSHTRQNEAHVRHTHMPKTGSMIIGVEA